MNAEKFIDEYNEIRFNERDVIEDFLKKQADLSYGNQMYEWAIEKQPTLMMWNGDKKKIVEIALDKNVFVTFRMDDGRYYECIDFAYGELSKIIEELPPVDEINRKRIDAELKSLTKSYNLLELLKEYPYEFMDNTIKYSLENILVEDGEVELEVGDGSSFGFLKEIPIDDYTKLANHIKKSVLRSSDQYKKLQMRLSGFGEKTYNFCEHENVCAVTITPDGTDLPLTVLDVSMESGKLEILVDVRETRLDVKDEHTMMLTEEMLNPSDLNPLVEFFGQVKIMDTTQYHNEELVNMINEIWNKGNKGMWAQILYAIAYRDEDELKDKDIIVNNPQDAIDYADLILMRVCDNKDLETIINYFYKLFS